MEEKILIVEDEKNIADLIAYAFKREGYKVEVAYNGKDGLDKVRSFVPHIVIIDIMMPIMNGFEVCKQIEHKEKLGIIMLTAKSDVVDKIQGLELGADDYITKPFDILELIARTKSLIRRLYKATDKQEEMRVKHLQVRLNQRKVILKEDELEFTPKEFELLVLLMSNRERVYTRDELLDRVWGMEYIGGTRTVDIHIQRIRKKLGEEYENLIQTVYRIGYKFVGETDED
ncbi:response regulator transcription factor [Niameybacter massiliensis]|uniref:Stage 0 sporulation protein A homolog n=1 Tax=Holtiella tumoricola TaxID=3018743 RepID=A0AA42J2S9_9FIRM|nr:response regulator transcription factor [Holtiella tumoricola]MDA3734089.1 response regulator transcription factor [Holtiella tumoricola]